GDTGADQHDAGAGVDTNGADASDAAEAGDAGPPCFVTCATTAICLRDVCKSRFTEFSIPTASSDPHGIVTGPDGNLWFTEFSGNNIGRITPAGELMEFPALAAFSYPYDIAKGPDGNLWFTENIGKIGKITVDGHVT